MKTYSRVETRRIGPWLAANVWTYANDDHLDTALRRIMREMGLEWSAKHTA